jgi:hypothetical protein
MDKKTYLQDTERQLSDCRFYEKLDSDPTLDFMQKIKRVPISVQFGNHWLTQSVSPGCFPCEL